MRIASSIVIVPVPLSVAPEPPSQESKWAESITYSLGRALPFISPMTLNTGTSPSACDSALTSMTGACLFSASR